METINLGATSSNYITSYKDAFAAIWAWGNNLFIKKVDRSGNFEDRQLLKIYELKHGERVISFIEHENYLIVGIDGLNSCKLLFCDLEKNSQFIREYKKHSLIDIYSDDSLIMVTHCWENIPKAIIYIGASEQLNRIITIENVGSAPFCMKHGSKFILTWYDKDLEIRLIDTSKNNVISKQLEIKSWCYTVGVCDDDRFYIGGFIPYIGTAVFVLDYDLNIIDNFTMNTATASPFMFYYKTPLLSIEPYDDDYRVELYNMTGKFIETIENATFPNFAVNGDIAIMIYINKESVLSLKVLDIIDFQII